MSFYSSLKSFYHGLLPRRLRTFLWMNPLTRAPREWLLRRAEVLAGDHELYNEEYFLKTIDPGAARSAPIMAKSLFESLSPSTVVDVGCGSGQLMIAMRALGAQVRGLEHADAALAICRQRGLEVQKFDLEHPNDITWRGDLATSTEVAEHLPEKYADRYVDLLCSLADSVFITAAVPGSTGTDHVNEQPNSYWIEKFRVRGYFFEESTSMQWRMEWRRDGVENWYWSSAMLFRRIK